MGFRSYDAPTDNQSTDDPFAEFPLESATSTDTTQDHDWLAEFPDEQAGSSTPRSKTWSRLSESVTNERERS
jgi:hypothetical protein